jgi:hypothetical protein
VQFFVNLILLPLLKHASLSFNCPQFNESNGLSDQFHIDSYHSHDLIPLISIHEVLKLAHRFLSSIIQ